MKPLTIRMKADDVAEMLIYSVIGEDFFGEGVTAKAFRDQLKTIKAKTLNLRINSPGGNVFEAAAILAALDDWKGRIEVDVDGLAASAASVVAMSGDRVRMASNAMMMIHDPYTSVRGSAEEMRSTAEVLDKVKGQIIATYQRRSKRSEGELSAMMSAETWLVGKDAVDAGLADEVVAPMPVAAMADHAKLFAKLGYRRAPEIKDAGPSPEVLAAIEETRKRREIAARL
jgi:ATP-dependent Clp protease, protease subunit